MIRDRYTCIDTLMVSGVTNKTGLEQKSKSHDDDIVDKRKQLLSKGIFIVHVERVYEGKKTILVVSFNLYGR